MKEHPIIFSTPMIPPIQDGSKTVTRRLTGLKRLNEFPDEWFYNGFVGGDGLGIKNNLPESQHHMIHRSGGGVLMLNCPYGKKGDLLWVRESFAVEKGTFLFKADAPNKTPYSPVYKPSIHMPRTAARILLQVENVRVERLQDITEDDAKAEGVEKGIRWMHIGKDEIIDSSHLFHNKAEYKIGLKVLWNQINGKRAPWESNPWVWVIEFKKINQTAYLEKNLVDADN